MRRSPPLPPLGYSVHGAIALGRGTWSHLLARPASGVSMGGARQTNRPGHRQRSRQPARGETFPPPVRIGGTAVATRLTETNAPPGSSISRWGWLLAASALLLVADGRNTIALAAWLAPASLLRFVRLERPLRGLALAYLALAIMRGIA